jgi:hypothetical protein
MAEALPAVSSPWKRRAVIAAAVLLALAAAFVGGRFSAPLQVKTIDTVRVEYRDRVVETVKTVEVMAKAETKIVYRDRVITKDGTITEHETERTATREDSVKNDQTEKTEEHAGVTERTVEKTVTLRPSWRVGLQVGASLRAPFVPIAGPLVLGLQVDYRLVGGLTAGLWLNTYGAAGVGVSFEF